MEASHPHSKIQLLTGFFCPTQVCFLSSTLLHMGSVLFHLGRHPACLLYTGGAAPVCSLRVVGAVLLATAPAWLPYPVEAPTFGALVSCTADPTVAKVAGAPWVVPGTCTIASHAVPRLQFQSCSHYLLQSGRSGVHCELLPEVERAEGPDVDSFLHCLWAL